MGQVKQLLKALRERQGDEFFDIALGNKQEMDCAVTLCDHLQHIYRKGMTVCDIGSGPGHYLRSLRRRLDSAINYFAVDYTYSHLEKGRQIFPGIPYVQADVKKLPFANKSFDIVVCNNVLTSLAPPISQALCELLRITKKHLIIRTIMGVTNYIVQTYPETILEGMSDDEFFLAPDVYSYRNMYSQRYLQNLIRNINEHVHISFLRDLPSEQINQDSKNILATRMVGGIPVSGNLVVDQYYILITI
jgi:ubiquinone/menaquinone biosynthesis C-methylase UbiE